MRIVSLLPSATEIVCALGLEDCLVGVSHECDYPASVTALPKVTRTRLAATASSARIDQHVRELVQAETSLYQLDHETIQALEPDLIVTQSLCAVCAVSDREVAELARQLPVPPALVRLSPTTFDEVLASILKVGQAAEVEARAARLVEDLRVRVADVVKRSQQLTQRPDVLLLEWIDPLFCAGHWNPELIDLAGGKVATGQAGRPSREIAWDELLAADPDVMIIACCGYSIDRALDDLPRLVSSRGFSQLKCIGNGRVYLADGSQYFNRPGPRLVDSLELLAHTLHPQVHPLPAYVEPAVRMKREPKIIRRGSS